MPMQRNRGRVGEAMQKQQVGIMDGLSSLRIEKKSSEWEGVVFCLPLQERQREKASPEGARGSITCMVLPLSPCWKVPSFSLLVGGEGKCHVPFLFSLLSQRMPPPDTIPCFGSGGCLMLHGGGWQVPTISKGEKGKGLSPGGVHVCAAIAYRCVQNTMLQHVTEPLR